MPARLSFPAEKFGHPAEAARRSSPLNFLWFFLNRSF
jgi:hypothetical protein